MHKARVAVFTDKLDWHVEATLKAYSALGTQPIPMRLSDCRFDSMRPSGLAIPGFHQLPDLVVVRDRRRLFRSGDDAISDFARA